MTDQATTTSSETKDGITVLTMHGTGVFNPTSLEAFNAVIDQVESDQEVTALFLTGQDKNFSQGLDLEFLMKLEQADFQQFVENTMVMAGRLLALPVPVVSVVNGHAFGLGAMIALASDYRVMRADRGFICLPEIDLGMPFIPSMSALVTNKLSGQIRRDMVLAGRRLGGEEALEYGVVDATAELDALFDLALQVVTPMLGKKRSALQVLKSDMHSPILQVIEASPGVRKS
jgi:enoyl-CoA hydratase/carnithine racemase